MNSFVPGPETARQFRSALGRFVTGVTVVTCHTRKGPLGITANSFASVSLDPPLVLWSPAKSSSRHDAFVDADHFVIHVLEASQAAVCQQFTKDGYNFDGLDLSSDSRDVPLIQGCLAQFECHRFAAHDAGDHTVILGKVVSAASREGEPLAFSSGALGRFQEGLIETAPG
ncbi:MAG: flavin reductase family protein [Pseudomonadota bacterium]